MGQKLVRFYSQHSWVVGVAHLSIVTILFVVFFNTPAIMEVAGSVSRLPEDVRIRIAVFALVLLVGTYATLVLDITLRQLWQDTKGVRVRDTLIGVWEGAYQQRHQTQGRVTLVVSFDNEHVVARITHDTTQGETVERVDITDIQAGEVFGLHTTSRSADQHHNPGTHQSAWQLELVVPAAREAYLVARRGDEGQGSAERDPTVVTLYKSPRD